MAALAIIAGIVTAWVVFGLDHKGDAAESKPASTAASTQVPSRPVSTPTPTDSPSPAKSVTLSPSDSDAVEPTFSGKVLLANRGNLDFDYDVPGPVRSIMDDHDLFTNGYARKHDHIALGIYVTSAAWESSKDPTFKDADLAVRTQSDGSNIIEDLRAGDAFCLTTSDHKRLVFVRVTDLTERGWQFDVTVWPWSSK